MFTQDDALLLIPSPTTPWTMRAVGRLVFGKTNTTNQAQLVARLLTSSAPWRPAKGPGAWLIQPAPRGRDSMDK